MLADANPAVTQYQSQLADIHHNIGFLLSQTGKSADAITAYESSRAINQKLADANPAVTQFQSRVAWNRNNIGLVQAAAGHPAEALESYRSARSINQILVDANPAVTQFQSHLAWNHTNIGNLLERTGNLTNALESHRSASAVYERLVGDNPKVAEFRSELALSLSGLGRGQRLAHRPKASVASLRRAIALRDVLPTPSIEATYELALDHALLSTLATDPGSGLSPDERSLEAERALGQLRLAVVAGFHDARKLRAVAGFESIRGRPDFQLLLMDLAMPTRAFAE